MQPNLRHTDTNNRSNTTSVKSAGSKAEGRKARPWRIWNVTVSGFSPAPYTAQSRAQALSQAYGSYGILDEAITYRDFLKIANARLANDTPQPDGYDYIREAYGVDVRINDRVKIVGEGASFDGRIGTVIYPGPATAHVKLILDGASRPSNFHPDSVILHERPVTPA